MILQEKIIPFEEVRDYLVSLDTRYPDIEADAKRQVWIWRDGSGEKAFEFRPPLPYPPISSDNQPLASWLNDLPEDPPSYLILLLQAGAASMGYFEDGEVVFHKAIKKYMTRRKQGKAQLNYLNTRGKSKAGSRVRLANTVRFFEEINQYLNDWEAYEPADRILFACTPRLWGMLFQAEPEPPFSKEDPRLVKVPYDVHVPDHEELLRINRMGLQGRLRMYKEYES